MKNLIVVILLNLLVFSSTAQIDTLALKKTIEAIDAAEVIVEGYVNSSIVVNVPGEFSGVIYPVLIKRILRGEKHIATDTVLAFQQKDVNKTGKFIKKYTIPEYKLLFLGATINPKLPEYVTEQLGDLPLVKIASDNVTVAVIKKKGDKNFNAGGCFYYSEVYFPDIKYAKKMLRSFDSIQTFSLAKKNYRKEMRKHKKAQRQKTKKEIQYYKNGVFDSIPDDFAKAIKEADLIVTGTTIESVRGDIVEKGLVRYMTPITVHRVHKGKWNYKNRIRVIDGYYDLSEANFPYKKKKYPKENIETWIYCLKKLNISLPVFDSIGNNTEYYKVTFNISPHHSIGEDGYDFIKTKKMFRYLRIRYKPFKVPVFIRNKQYYTIKPWRKDESRLSLKTKIERIKKYIKFYRKSKKILRVK